jgi:phospholipase C
MHSSRRDFLKKAAMLSGGTAMAGMFPPVIQKALAINPAVGSTFYDAEHVVFLMQENRSFDHQLGTLQGVRGFNDPRAINLPNKNKVWLQTDKNGNTYAPFHLDVKDTKVAWMGSLPHGWSDQTDAMNGGKYDKWLDTKRARSKEYGSIPLTLGYCTRKDFPFYYSLADAFTVCDQNFCSSITGTHSNRHYWMTGTVRERNDAMAIAHLWNVDNYEYPELEWTTYPERLEENGVAWKVYQNELTMGFDLSGEQGAWLANFGCNVLEYYKKYNVRLHAGGIANLQTKKENLQKQIVTLEKQPDAATNTRLAAAKKLLARIETAQTKYTADSYKALPQQQKNLNSKAFTTNINDPHYHELEQLNYNDNGTDRKLNVPKGDVFHQFREDVKNGTLPTVSWLMAPGHFSDHPGEPWFGPWYVSEAMEILLQNPEVWKKTIFIITYDENDGYFDHIPPYTVPNPYKENTGKVSKNIDPKMDFVTNAQQTNPSGMASSLRESSIGLGYRVPMIIASPWTRGGYVCSELFDHTSSLQFLENFLEKKFSKKVQEENITQWRRTICGDLTSVFRPYNGEKIDSPVFLNRDHFIESIHQAQFKQVPNNYKKLTADEVALVNTNPAQSPNFPVQEKGTRPACPIPYELYVHANYNKGSNSLTLAFAAGNKVFGDRSAGSPFRVYAMAPYKQETLRTWDYSIAAGDSVQDEWSIGDFETGRYHLRVYAPNGFYREFTGGANNPLVKIVCHYQQNGKSASTGNVIATITNTDTQSHTITLTDNSYKNARQTKTIGAGASTDMLLNLARSHHWYDFSITVQGNDTFEERYAGHVETGAVSKTDPLMGGVM